MFEKKFVQKMKNYTFQICKNVCKILNNPIFNQEKLKMCKFPLTGCLPKICNFFLAKLVQSVSLCQRLSKKLNFIRILSKSGPKQRFSLLQAVCLRAQAVSIKAQFQA